MACVATKLVGRRLGACMLRGQLLTHSVCGSGREVATYSIKPAEPALSDIFGGEALSVRSSTSAVASRLYQQETVQLDYGTPMTMDSAKEDSEQVGDIQTVMHGCSCRLSYTALLGCRTAEGYAKKSACGKWRPTVFWLCAGKDYHRYQVSIQDCLCQSRMGATVWLQARGSVRVSR